MSPRIRSLALGGAALWFVAGVGSAYAADATEVADALVAAMKASDNTNVSYESAEGSGDNVTVTGLTATNPTGGTLTVPSLLITGAEMRNGGGFTAEGMSAEGVSVVEPDSTVKMETAEMSDVTVPSADEVAAESRIAPFSELTITGISIEGSDVAAPITVSDVDVQLQMDADGIPSDFDLMVSTINVPNEVLQSDPQTGMMMQQLGYDSLQINLGISGAYATDGDKLDLRSFTLDMADIGKLTVTAKVNGVSMTKFAENGPDAIGPDSTLEALTIRFENAGIVEKGLDMQAQQMGVSREDMVAQFTGAMPLMLNALQNPAFQEEVASAATTFLNDPQSIEVTATPATPVKFEEIMGAAMMAPGKLADVLSIDVMANQ